MLVNTVKRKRKKFGTERGLRLGKSWFAYLLLAPALFNFGVFFIIPNISSVFLSFRDSYGTFTLGNYQWVLSQLFTKGGDGLISEAFRNTLIYFAVGYFIINAVNIIVAYALYKKMPGHRAARFLLNFPAMLGGLIMVSVYKSFIGSEGPIITFLYDHGIISEKITLLRDSRYALGASIGYSLWLCVGGTYLWTSGALARIPSDILEAAKLDGITPLKEFIHIILPMISGTLATIYIIGISGILSAGGATLFLTYGEYGTMTLSFWIYKQMYTGGGYGTSSALGILMTLVTIPLVYFTKWLTDKLIPDVSY